MRNYFNPQQITLFDSIDYRCRSGGGDLRRFVHTYDNIINLESVLCAWREFLKSKKKKEDVLLFRLRLTDNIYELFTELSNRTYCHGSYSRFTISDPKPREINKSSVRDRVVHHLLYKALYPYFDKKFIHDSYSCRLGKGTHKAMNRFRYFGRIVSKNNTRTCWVLKCDIRKFFASIDHGVLKSILEKHIEDKDILHLLYKIIDSFHTYSNPAIAKNEYIGLPLGNLTSQLLVNIYMNEFDQYVKHKLKVKYYVRYADDFVVLSDDKDYLENLIWIFSSFLFEKLKLSLHPEKVFIKTLASGVDFLGWVHFLHHRVLRTSTKRRMIKKIAVDSKKQVVDSYLGLLSYGDTYILRNHVKNLNNAL